MGNLNKDYFRHPNTAAVCDLLTLSHVWHQWLPKLISLTHKPLFNCGRLLAMSLKVY